MADIEPGEHPFCLQCDYPLFWLAPRERAAPVAQRDEPEPVGPQIACVACGAINEAGRVLCHRCGASMRPVVSRRRRTWEVAVEEEEGLSPARRFAMGLAMGFGILLVVAVVVGIAAYLLWPRSEWVVTVLDSGEASWDISATTFRGLPAIAYVDAADFSVRVVTCGNSECDGERDRNIHTTVATLGDRGQGHGTAIAIGSDDRPIVAFRHGVQRALTVAHCGDAQCLDRGGIVITTLDPPEGDTVDGVDVGSTPSIAIGSDGLALIAYQDAGRGALKIAHCENVVCSAATISTLDRSGAGPVGGEPVIRVRPDGLPVIAFRDEGDNALKLARCGDERCTNAAITSIVVGGGRQPGYGTSMVLRPGGIPLIVDHDLADEGIYLTVCDDADCSTHTRRRVDRPEDGTSAEPSVVLDRNGHAVITYRQRTPGDERGQRILKVVRCNAQFVCGAPQVIDGAGRTGYGSVVQLLPNGTLVIAYGDATGGTLKYAYLRP